MIEIKNHLGNISLTNQFFSTLIGSAVSDCFGVVDMNAGNTKQSLVEMLPFIRRKKYLDKGVTVRVSGEKLYIDLHITVMYGVNVSSIVKSIQHKVRYSVEEETDLSVERVNVYVDSINASPK